MGNVLLTNKLKSLDDLIAVRDSFSETEANEVMMSWERCRQYGISRELEYPLHVLNEREFADVMRENENLLQISEDLMETVSRNIVGSRFIIALTDRNGVIIRVKGDKKIKKAVEEGGLKTGVDWSERSAGSNAIGMALETGRPMQLSGSEHYCSFGKRTTGAAAPIKDPEGNVIGIIVFTARFRDFSYQALGNAIAIAASIENSLKALRLYENERLDARFRNFILDSISEAEITLNRQGVIRHFNHIAASIFGLKDEDVGRRLSDVLDEGNQEILRHFGRGSNLVDQEIEVKSRTGETRMILNMEHLIDTDGMKIGTVMIFNEQKRFKTMASRYSGATARLSFDNLIGQNGKFLETVAIAKAAAKSEASIILLGESGTGKDVFAQAIHNHSWRKSGPFVSVNCGAIPKELVASTLFGYVDGAFTGARKGGSAGQFEMADNGTIFLDEIGEMPIDTQVHLLRVLENRMITRVGDAREIPVNVRVIAATNADLIDLVKKGLFREDLYYRLNVISIMIPPLRERRDDIVPLSAYIYRQLFGKEIKMSPEFREELLAYDWPGNIRELRNVIERSYSLSSDGSTGIPVAQSKTAPEEEEIKISDASMKISDMERSMLEKLMAKYEGNITRVAKELGVARTTVYRKLKKYEL